LSEVERISRVRQGDEAAWELLVREHQQPVFRLCYLLLGDPDDAEDVAQECFIRAFYALGSFDAERPLRPWLLSIATNLARNRRRSLGRYLAALKRALRVEPAPVVEFVDRSGQRWESETLWAAVRRLAQPDQEVIYLRYFLDLSEAEMAQALAVAAGTVKSRLHRALARLRAVVDRDFPSLREERQA
jgi:RNA polymerase sigma-70 factor (ECF subfamily)